MIYKETQLFVSDNSGIKSVKCIRILNLKSQSIGTVGNVALVRIYRKNKYSSLKKKLLYYGLIIMVKQLKFRKDGIIIKFKENRVLLFSNVYKFLGSKILGILTKEIWLNTSQNKKEKQKYYKILSFCNNIV